MLTEKRFREICTEEGISPATQEKIWASAKDDTELLEGDSEGEELREVCRKLAPIFALLSAIGKPNNEEPPNSS